MIYNLHPIFVHFPIAFLFIYSLLIIIPLPKWFPKVSWKHIEQMLLLLGVLGAFAALSTGETAEYITRPNHNVVEMHAFFAGLSTWIYGLLLLGEILLLVLPFIQRLKGSVIEKILSGVAKVLTQKTIVIVLAIVGFVAISLTGLLGGVMVYGVTADPFSGIVLKILGITL